MTVKVSRWGSCSVYTEPHLETFTVLAYFTVISSATSFFSTLQHSYSFYAHFHLHSHSHFHSSMLIFILLFSYLWSTNISPIGLLSCHSTPVLWLKKVHATRKFNIILANFNILRSLHLLLSTHFCLHVSLERNINFAHEISRVKYDVFRLFSGGNIFVRKRIDKNFSNELFGIEIHANENKANYDSSACCVIAKVN